MNQTLNFFLVALGGAVGSMARYGFNLLMKNWELLSTLAITRDGRPVAVALPWGTLGVNILGSLVIGVVSEWAGSRLPMSAEVRLLLATGFCGGFTTLSSLMLEMNDFFRAKEFLFGGVYLALSLVLPFLALWGGIWLVKLLAGNQ